MSLGSLLPSPGEPLVIQDTRDKQYIINTVWYRFFSNFAAELNNPSVGGDLTGTVDSSTVIKINTAKLGVTTATSGNLLIADGVQWNTQPLTGDAVINASGVVTLSNSSSTRSNLGLGSIATQNSSNVTITGGTGSGLTISGSIINGSTLDNTPIGSTTQSSAKFTTGSVEIGTGTGSSNLGGTANANVTSASNSSTTETDLMVYTLPANSLVNNGDHVEIVAWGTTTANANNKTVRLKFGSTYLLQSNTAAASGASWMFRAIVAKTGSATETALAEMQSSASFTNTVSTTAPTESTTAAIIIKVTGQSATASNDITQTGMVVKWFPAA